MREMNGRIRCVREGSRWWLQVGKKRFMGNIDKGKRSKVGR